MYVQHLWNDVIHIILQYIIIRPKIEILSYCKQYYKLPSNLKVLGPDVALQTFKMFFASAWRDLFEVAVSLKCRVLPCMLVFHWQRLAVLGKSHQMRD